jgi:uncharacterized protein YndB with AHSA1/START domain
MVSDISNAMPGAPTEDTTAPPFLIRVVADFPTAAPERLFDYWSRLDLLRLWWKPEGLIDLRVGGNYDFRWPASEYRLTGRYLAIEPGQRLAFTWAWDFVPDVVTEVHLQFAPLAGGGTRLTLVHGPFSDTEWDQESRGTHLAGWLHFLTILQGVV